MGSKEVEDDPILRHCRGRHVVTMQSRPTVGNEIVREVLLRRAINVLLVDGGLEDSV